MSWGKVCGQRKFMLKYNAQNRRKISLFIHTHTHTYFSNSFCKNSCFQITISVFEVTVNINILWTIYKRSINMNYLDILKNRFCWHHFLSTFIVEGKVMLTIAKWGKTETILWLKLLDLLNSTSGLPGGISFRIKSKTENQNTSCYKNLCK